MAKLLRKLHAMLPLLLAALGCSRPVDSATLSRFSEEYLAAPAARPVFEKCLRLDQPQRRGCFHGLGYAEMGAVYHQPGCLARACAGGFTT